MGQKFCGEQHILSHSLGLELQPQHSGLTKFKVFRNRLNSDFSVEFSATWS